MFGRKRTYLSKSQSVSPDRRTSLSFCIPHRDRLEYLKKTLKTNLVDNFSERNRIDFVLVDFGSAEDVTKWVKENFSEEIRTGYLKYFEADGLGDWHASIAKNTVHNLATGSVLVNLDCDNFTGEQGGRFVADHFEKSEDDILFWQYSKKKLDGTFGRIALTKDIFHRLGGYDEQLLQMGFQDGDLKDRAISLGARLVHDKNRKFNRAIKNEKFIPKEMSWKLMNEKNEKFSRENILSGNLIANSGRTIGLTDCKQITI